MVVCNDELNNKAKASLLRKYSGPVVIRCFLACAILVGFIHITNLSTSTLQWKNVSPESLESNNLPTTEKSRSTLNTQNKKTIYKTIRRNTTTTGRHQGKNHRSLILTSTVDYFSCCGAGHRLSKLVDAHYMANRYLKFGLRVFFGFCGKQEVFSWLFNTSQVADYDVFSQGLQLQVKNDVPGFERLTRKGPDFPCGCPEERWPDDVEFYSELRERFRAKGRVQTFLSQQLAIEQHTVIGMHVRAGNGESGDFERKKRGITDPQWAASMAKQLIQLSQGWTKPPLVFLATDTATIEITFRELLQSHMKVVTWKQERPIQGQGVLFGENYHNSFNVSNGNSDCLNGWEDAFSDMIVLSHTDVVVAARPSSFTQSLPMTLVLSTPKESRKVRRPYCEVNPSATEVQCFEDLNDWCCNGTTSFSLEGIQRYEYRKMPNADYLKSKELESKIRARPRFERECIPTPRYAQRQCLPHMMPDEHTVEEAGRMVFLDTKKNHGY